MTRIFISPAPARPAARLAIAHASRPAEDRYLPAKAPKRSQPASQAIALRQPARKAIFEGEVPERRAAAEKLAEGAFDWCSELDARRLPGAPGPQLEHAYHLAETLLLDSDPEVRASAQRALGNLLNSADIGRRVSDWQRAARNTHPQVRIAAVEVLDKLYFGDEGLRETFLAAAARDPDAGVRLAALRALRRICCDATRAAAITAVNDPSAEVRAHVPGALGYWHFEPDVEAALVRLAADPDMGVRIAVARSLSDVSTWAQVPKALELLDEHIACDPGDAATLHKLDLLRGKAMANAAQHGGDEDRARVARWIPKLTTVAKGDIQYMAQSGRADALLEALCEAPSSEVRAVAQAVRRDRLAEAKGRTLPAPPAATLLSSADEAIDVTDLT